MHQMDLEKAATNYSYLRGLFLVPTGMLLILSALGNWEVGPFSQSWAFPVAAVAIAAAYVPLNRYYNDNYGRLSPTMREQIRGAAALALGVAVMIGGSLLLRGSVSWSLDLPVNDSAITFAAVMLIWYAVGIGLKVHHVIIWGGLLVIGALPVWNGGDPSNTGILLAGVALMASGVFDHRLFVQTFGSPQGLGHGNSDAGA